MSIAGTGWILGRAVIYATFFVSILFVFLPARVLERTGVGPPVSMGFEQILGITLTSVGAALGLWCILTFVYVGKGTQAPFDPPRTLVIRGPYRALRNPMYAGATLALLGVALYYASAGLLGYSVLFWLATHLGVVLLEEPHLRRSFGSAYEEYCAQTGRWWPRLR
jgi:protein-S-isoprenylcysteine O-methyltransferase Ste14